MDSIAQFDAKTVNAETIEFIESLIEQQDMRSTNVRRASQDASVLFEWIHRLVKFVKLHHAVQLYADLSLTMEV